MLRYYGKDLLDWHRGELSSRRLQVLLKHLPRDSSVNRELFGEASDWSVTDHLLAAAVDHLAAANWMFASVNTPEDEDPPERPDPVPRPDGTPYTGSAGEGAAPETAEPAPSAETLVRFFG
ncbi:hypothetical protein J7F03_02125 [Streptomyces sp. ISL-43]|uniref:hypothetical protein n=1 Tax=Streptomyces sp. ISL-43 TaxID=2819183 RepID=UPI001BEAC1E9|nr:hypothetical protein [Streptomyces sp. ISL-43]MBT2445905.1 hypothetical protein [Streptomyces sp. ISL-43]